MNNRIKHSGDQNEGQIENLGSRYPYAYTNDTLQRWAKSTKFSGTFEAYLPGTGEKRGIITVTNIGPSDGQLKIKWGDNNFALLPEVGKNDPIYLSAETVKTLGITSALVITGKNQEPKDNDISKELALVQAERRLREAASKKSTTLAELKKLEKELTIARAAIGREITAVTDEFIPDTERPRG